MAMKSAFYVALFFMLLMHAVECAAAAGGGGLTHPKFGALISWRKLLISELQASVTFKYSRKPHGDGEGEGEGKGKEEELDADGNSFCQRQHCHPITAEICAPAYKCNKCDWSFRCTDYPKSPVPPNPILEGGTTDGGDGDDANNDGDDDGCSSKPCDELFPYVDICKGAYGCDICDGKFCTGESNLPTPMDWEH